MIPEEGLETISGYLKGRDDIVAAYLFGSTVKNRERESSDLDLAILFKEGMEIYRRFQAKLQIANELEEKVMKKVDVVDVRSADQYFVHQIMKNKILVFEGDLHERVAFEVRHRKHYFDFMPFYKEYHRQSHKRLMEREVY